MNLTIRCRLDGPDGPRPELKRYAAENGEAQLEGFLRKYGLYLFAAYLAGAFTSLAYYDVEANKSHILAFFYFGVPMVGLCIYLFLFKLPAFRSRVGTITGLIYTLGFSLVLGVVGEGYVLLINAYGPGQSDIEIQGKIVELSVSAGRTKGYYVTIVAESGKKIELAIHRKEYAQLTEGQIYSQRWKIGALGLLYKLKS